MKKKTGPVLIVDDDPAYTYLLEEALNGCQQRPAIHVLHTGTDLLTWLGANQRPSLILLDVNMPRANGFSVLAQLKDSDLYQAIPVVMMTVVGDRHSVVNAYNRGASAYIIKPASVEALQRRLYLLSCFWVDTDQSSGARLTAIRQAFERDLSHYRRAVYERLERWQNEGRDLHTNNPADW